MIEKTSNKCFGSFHGINLLFMNFAKNTGQYKHKNENGVNYVGKCVLSKVVQWFRAIVC